MLAICPLLLLLAICVIPLIAGFFYLRSLRAEKSEFDAKMEERGNE
jgi:hypothetical protein